MEQLGFTQDLEYIKRDFSEQKLFIRELKESGIGGGSF